MKLINVYEMTQALRSIALQHAEIVEVGLRTATCRLHVRPDGPAIIMKVKSLSSDGYTARCRFHGDQHYRAPCTAKKAAPAVSGSLSNLTESASNDTVNRAKVLQALQARDYFSATPESEHTLTLNTYNLDDDEETT